MIFEGVGFLGCGFEWAAVDNEVADAKMLIALALYVGPEFFVTFVCSDDVVYI